MTTTPARRALNAAIHAAAKAKGLDDDAYRDMLEVQTGKRSAKDCTDAQLRQVLDHLNGGTRNPAPASAAQSPHAKLARALWISLHNLGEVDDPRESALRQFVERQHGVADLRFVRAAEAAPIIEALKDWCTRAGVCWADFDKLQPAFKGRRAVLAAQWRILSAAGTAPAIDLGAHAYSLVKVASVHFCSTAQLDLLITDLGARLRAAKGD
ncbi:regulatory protein GemA [Paramagnetospirillum magneticum]|uniref:Mu-like prophage protein gp16 n=1 Tax=Paramagnetospirillum magneticum (strain ATCC 700264 / AMB-1) TaxID=342108 RepID=Q2W6G9_PARM1|nr:regulatory protein GemA [Paramagnetospirillum magneticum]BAE50556.1 Mu-like prophage protein gp16 [Paramagnetospirillum magneticum AMB-1]